MKIIADMHTHTISSGHAYSTVNELAASAAEKGLQAFAITDHGPAMPGGPHIYHFGAMRFIPPEIRGVRVFVGCEANIVNIDGRIDLPEDYLGRLEFVMAGFHEFCGFDSQGTALNTKALVNAMRNPAIQAISHPGNPAFPVDYEIIAREAAITGTALEINNSSFNISRCGSRPNCEKLAQEIKRFNTPVVVGSDAHISQNVGEFGSALEVILKAGIAEAQVINSSLAKLMAFLGLPD
jgi:putative hydrolase